MPPQLAILVVDDERRCIEANLAACRLLGLPRRAVLGRTFDDLLASEMHSRLDHVWRAFREDGGFAGPFELRSQAALAEEVHITVTATVLPGRHLLILAPSEFEREPPEGAPEGSFEPGNSEVTNQGPRFARGAPTSRERQVLSLLATGASDDQIAEMLDVSPATVQTHVRNAKAKLGARTRVQAVALALRAGMITLG